MYRFLLAFMFLTCCSLYAATTDTATVTFTIVGIDSIEVSGDPAPFTVAPPGVATDTSTTYSVTTNGLARRITGQLNDNMPAGTTLQVQLEAPTGAISTGPQLLTTVPASLVTAINTVAQSNLAITYTLTATPIAQPQGPSTRIVTYTITSP